MIVSPTRFEPALGQRHPSRSAERLAETRALQTAFARFPTIEALRASAEGPRLAERAAALLDVVHLHAPATPPPGAAEAATLRVVHWNIEHGNWYEQVETALREHAVLSTADVVMLNEVDLGCARAGNRDVTADLADALGFHAAFTPMFIESTLGRDDDEACAAGLANEESLVGVSVLSRWPIGDVRLVPLPGPEAIQFDLERMVGRFVALVCEVLHPEAPFLAVSVHLEVHRARVHREQQMGALMAALEVEQRPIVLAGDFNSHTFDRGLWNSTWSSAVPLLTWSDRALGERFTRPDRGPHREGVFDALASAGFSWSEFSDHAPTLDVRFNRLDEVKQLPGPLQRLTRSGLDWLERRARLRLDWIAARSFVAAGPAPSGATALGLDGPGRASDHAPIAASLAWPAR